MFTNKTEPHVACHFNCIVETDKLMKVTDCHVHWKSGDISETVQNRRDVTIQATDRNGYTAYRIAAIVMTLSGR